MHNDRQSTVPPFCDLSHLKRSPPLPQQKSRTDRPFPPLSLCLPPLPDEEEEGESSNAFSTSWLFTQLLRFLMWNIWDSCLVLWHENEGKRREEERRENKMTAITIKICVEVFKGFYCTNFQRNWKVERELMYSPYFWLSHCNAMRQYLALWFCSLSLTASPPAPISRLYRISLVQPGR